MAALSTRIWLAGALAFALLAAWQAALLHPLEHVDELGQFVHLHGADGGDARGENGRHDGPSDPSDKLGDALAALTACAFAAFATLTAVFVHHAAIPLRYRAPRAAEAPPFHAQAPPTLL